MVKVPIVSNIALKALERVSTSKQNFLSCNQKEQKLTKNPNCSLFGEKILRQVFSILYSIIFLLRKKVLSDTQVVNCFTTKPNVVNWAKCLESYKIW